MTTARALVFDGEDDVCKAYDFALIIAAMLEDERTEFNAGERAALWRLADELRATSERVKERFYAAFPEIVQGRGNGAEAEQPIGDHPARLDS